MPCCLLLPLAAPRVSVEWKSAGALFCPRLLRTPRLASLVKHQLKQAQWNLGSERYQRQYASVSLPSERRVEVGVLRWSALASYARLGLASLLKSKKTTLLECPIWFLVHASADSAPPLSGHLRLDPSRCACSYTAMRPCLQNLSMSSRSHSGKPAWLM